MTSTPKYYTQKLRILASIADAKPGDPMPTERELASRFDTSRTTIRQALSELVHEGRIVRAHGRGTFVAQPPVIHVRSLTSLSEDLTGTTLDSVVLEVREIVVGAEVACDPAARAEVAAGLELDSGSTVTRVERVRTSDGEALAHEVAHLPGTYPGLAGELASRGSLYATLRDAYDVVLASAEDEIGTGLADPDDSARLGIAVGQPLLLITRTARSGTGVPLEFTRSRFRGDRFRFLARS